MAESTDAKSRCHCGQVVEPRNPDPWEGRMDAYCYECALNRCDCYPNECPVKYPPSPPLGLFASVWAVLKGARVA